MATRCHVPVVVLLCALGEAMRVDRHREKLNSELNLCMEGRFAPELFLMGAAKAGTSTFATNFESSPSVMFPDCIGHHPNKITCKEMHYFGNEEEIAKGEYYWLTHYPKCNQDVRIVTTDLSPRYHRNPDVPGQLLQYYGSRISRVVFLTLLREPLSLLQSNFYFNELDETHNVNFSTWIRELTNRPSGPEYENAMYAVQLPRIFETLNREQFVICPMKYSYSGKGSTPPVFEGLWKRFGLQEPDNYTGDVIVKNTADHPDLTDEMDHESLEQIKHFFHNISGSWVLANLFAASSSQEAPHLYAYEGAPDAKYAIQSWIEDGW